MLWNSLAQSSPKCASPVPSLLVGSSMVGSSMVGKPFLGKYLVGFLWPLNRVLSWQPLPQLVLGPLSLRRPHLSSEMLTRFREDQK